MRDNFSMWNVSNVCNLCICDSLSALCVSHTSLFISLSFSGMQVALFLCHLRSNCQMPKTGNICSILLEKLSVYTDSFANMKDALIQLNGWTKLLRPVIQSPVFHVMSCCMVSEHSRTVTIFAAAVRPLHRRHI